MARADSSSAPQPQPAVARRVREFFVQECSRLWPALIDATRKRLLDQSYSATTTHDIQSLNELLRAFEHKAPVWASEVSSAWKKALVPPTATLVARFEAIDLSLVDDSVVERRIVASRLAQALSDKVSWELGALRQRMQVLDGTDDLAEWDVLRPEVLARHMLDQWASIGLSLEQWRVVSEVVEHQTVTHLIEVYKEVNAHLAEAGVLPGIDGRVGRVRLTASSDPRAESPTPPATAPASLAAASATAMAPTAPMPMPGSAEADGTGKDDPAGIDGQTPGHSGLSEAATLPPTVRVRQAAVAVAGQIRRVLTERVPGFDPSRPVVAAAQAAALTTQRLPTRAAGMAAADIDVGTVESATRELRDLTREFKQRASSDAEKATIEIVALMFQSILAEERIAPSMRVWFSRLQIPVLRVALSEPEFFGSLQHPARQLIDRMGACVLGFDGGEVTIGALETEIRRLVQMIEQYPETGHRVFKLAFQEFQTFLSRFLTDSEITRRAVTVAQQVEQKETLSVQYTIELRNLLQDMPVHDEVRDFLFKIWAEVLAVAAIKHGARHEDTRALQSTAADLVWAASAKPNREERARVIRDMPALMQRLRQGMSLLGLTDADQDTRLKTLAAILALAFRSQTQAIPQAQIEALARRMANLEDVVSDDLTGDLTLDPHSLELMLGMDATTIEVVTDGGEAQPAAAMLAWAREIEPGQWFQLDHNGRLRQVQYAWTSTRKQLHLFAAPEGQLVLFQLRRLAAYLQAGLLTPTEQESLTTRATREALAKLEANPERLLN